MLLIVSESQHSFDGLYVSNILWNLYFECSSSLEDKLRAWDVFIFHFQMQNATSVNNEVVIVFRSMCNISLQLLIFGFSMGPNFLKIFISKWHMTSLFLIEAFLKVLKMILISWKIPWMIVLGNFKKKIVQKKIC